jgi:KUP system potassium uptake protein
MPRWFHSVPALLREPNKRGCAIDLVGVTYYVGHETVVPADDEKGLPRWVEALVSCSANID